MRNTIIPTISLLLAACGGEQGSTQASTSNVVGKTEEKVALGLTERELRNADLVDANGVELGEVEGIVRGPDGKVTRLLIEIEDSSPDRYVHVEAAGLQPFENGGDTDLRTSMTRAQLLALPEVRRQ